jgi:hypothetical protein
MLGMYDGGTFPSNVGNGVSRATCVDTLDGVVG